ERHAGEFNAVNNFHGREGVDVHGGDGFFHRPQYVSIVKRGQSVGQSALDADLGGAELPGLDGLLRDLIGVEKIRVVLARAAAKAQNLHPTKQMLVKLMLRLTTYVTRLPASSARSRSEAARRPRRSSPSEWANS